MLISGARVLITGAARGLGRSFVLDLASAGARVGACDLDRDGLTDLAGEAKAMGLTVWTHVADVSHESSVEQLLDAFVAAHGGVDALVNNAGLNRDGLLVKKRGEEVGRLSLADWKLVIDVDLTGVFLCAREAACYMIKQPSGGVIVSVSSLARHGNTGQTNYSAAKAGVVAMTTVWAKELARYNVRAVAIAPGLIATEMAASMPEETRRRMIDAIPRDRLGEPDEVSHALRFVLENEYVNGRVIEVDGGLRL